VRVPEAYLLVRQYDTMRPGLLVLDADGRRVASLALPGMGAPAVEPEALARWLAAGEKAPAREIWRFTADGPDAALAKLQDALEARDGVAGVVREGAAFQLTVRPSGLAPAALAAAAKAHGVAVALREPVLVRFAPGGDAEAAARGLGALPGVWDVTPTPALQAHVTGLFLRPDDLERAAGGCRPDVEARAFLLPDVPKGGTGCRVAMAPLELPGVLAIHADLFGERQTVVGRRGEVSWNDVRAAFVKAGCAAEPAED